MVGFLKIFLRLGVYNCRGGGGGDKKFALKPLPTLLVEMFAQKSIKQTVTYKMPFQQRLEQMEICSKTFFKDNCVIANLYFLEDE